MKTPPLSLLLVGLLSAFTLAAHATTYYSAYGQDRVNNITADVGIHSFQVNGIAANKNTEWYVDGVYTGSAENDWSGNPPWPLNPTDPQYTRYIAGSVKIEALIYDRFWTREQKHTWNVALRKPDLRVTSLKMGGSTAADQTFVSGQDIRLDFQGYNGGNAASKRNVQMKWYYGTSAYSKANDIYVGYLGENNGLSVNEYEWEADASWTVPTVSSRTTFWLTAVIDSDGNNPEGDETNNEATMRFYVDPPPKPDLIVTAVWTEPASPLEGQTYVMKATV
ncbi:MAG: hypothetical protein FJ387_24165, partial [Verrucomicrobia bacterium]|nr:hypothetical protein [Verrucomicrobiota bacterium]